MIKSFFIFINNYMAGCEYSDKYERRNPKLKQDEFKGSSDYPYESHCPYDSPERKRQHYLDLLAETPSTTDQSLPVRLAYDGMLSAGIWLTANQGATPEQIANAAGITIEKVINRLIGLQ